VEFTLRDYRPEDFDSLWSIDQKCFSPGIAYSRRELGIYIRRRGSFTIVAEGPSERTHALSASIVNPVIFNPGIVGFIVAEASRGVGHVISIDVLPEARRSGVGSKLLAMAEERLCSEGCRAVRLETAVDNGSALSFYKRHLYHVIKAVSRYYANGTDALLLEKELPTLPKARISG
jgi:[ribosomal protein S18]-alanine N-acetyltransferase